MSKSENPIDKLLDVEDNEPITLYDENDNAVRFEQIALIPYEEKLYAMLKPIDKMEGVAEDEGVIFVFEDNEQTNEQFLKVVNDDKTIDAVFALYLDLINEEEGAKKASKKEEATKETAPKAEEKKKPAEKKPAKSAKKETVKTAKKTTKKA
ncbi:MAG: DUF1292 domain-containing protein [Clostridia bacterium]|nr:DUF1292 domain-containing protein [Clostridia bacterium]